MKAFNEETNWLYLYIGFLPLWCVFSRVFWSIFFADHFVASLWSHILGEGGWGGIILHWDEDFNSTKLSYFYFSLLVFFLLFLWYPPPLPPPVCLCVSNLEEKEGISLWDEIHTLLHCWENLAFCLPFQPCLLSLPEMHPMPNSAGPSVSHRQLLI